MELLTSRSTKTITLPHAPDHTITIRKLSSKTAAKATALWGESDDARIGSMTWMCLHGVVEWPALGAPLTVETFDDLELRTTMFLANAIAEFTYEDVLKSEADRKND